MPCRPAYSGELGEFEGVLVMGDKCFGLFWLLIV